MAKNFRELEAKMSPGARARSDAKSQKMIEEMALNELRQAMGITQERLAKALRINSRPSAWPISSSCSMERGSWRLARTRS
jgi:hypothetical protein